MTARRVPEWAVAALVACGLLWANRSLQGDVYWLLAAGRQLWRVGWETGDPFAGLAQGRPWANQQWLAQLLFYGLHSLGGMRLLLLGYAAGLAAGWALLSSCLCRARLRWALLPLYLVSAVTVLDVRAGLFSLLGISALVVLTRWPWSWRRAAGVVTVMVVWANLHAGVLAGLLYVGVSAALELAAAAPGRRVRQAGLSAGLMGICGLALLLTPLGMDLWSYQLSISTNPVMAEFTREWRPLLASPLAATYAFLVGLLWLTWWWRAPFRPRWPGAVMALVFAVLACTSARQVLWLAPISVDLLRRWGHLSGPRPASTAAPWPWAAATATGLALLGWWLAPTPRPEPRTMAPALAQLQRLPAGTRVLAGAGTGSLLMWLRPQQPYAVDGRLELYRPRELRMVRGVLNGRAWAMPFLRQHRFGAVLTRRPRSAWALRQAGWRLVYRRRADMLLVAPEVRLLPAIP